MDIILVLLLLAAIIWFWMESLNVREQAIQAAVLACRQIGVQLLDQTVSLDKLRPARSPQGRMTFRRTYSFEFSAAGVERRRGWAILLGRRLLQVHLEEDENTLIFSEADIQNQQATAESTQNSTKASK